MSNYGDFSALTLLQKIIEFTSMTPDPEEDLFEIDLNWK